VTGVSPDRISLESALVAGDSNLPDRAGVPVSIYGRGLTADCTPEATVNGVPVESHDVLRQQTQLRALLIYRDFGGRDVSSRYLEVQLRVAGPGFAREAIKHVLFVE